MFKRPENMEGQSQPLIRYDGNQWRRWDLGDGGYVVLTSRGQELLTYNAPLEALLGRYAEEIALVRTDQPRSNEDPVRRFFRVGGNSSIYQVGDADILIKEGKRVDRPSLWESLDRMDYLYGICMSYMHPNVRVPDHFGLYVPADPTESEYMMMRKINNGVTVRDVVRKRLTVSDEIRKQVEQDFSSLRTRLRVAIQETKQHQQIPFRNLLPDWDDDNVLVDFTTHPAAKPYTLWIIDQ